MVLRACSMRMYKYVRFVQKLIEEKRKLAQELFQERSCFVMISLMDHILNVLLKFLSLSGICNTLEKGPNLATDPAAFTRLTIAER